MTGINYDALYVIADRNSVANTVADVCFGMDGLEEQIKEKFRVRQSKTIYQQVLCNAALQELYAKLDEHKTSGIFLKGTLLKDLYPKQYLRSMSDVDVFACESDMDLIYSVMTGAGYKTGVIGSGNHYEYLRQNIVKVEYHPELVALESEYGRRVFRKLWLAYV